MLKENQESLRKASDEQALAQQVARQRGGQPGPADTLANSGETTPHELLLLDDTLVKAGERTLVTGFLPEMVVGPGQGGEAPGSSVGSTGLREDSRNSKFAGNALTHSSTRLKASAKRGHPFGTLNVRSQSTLGMAASPSKLLQLSAQGAASTIPVTALKVNASTGSTRPTRVQLQKNTIVKREVEARAKRQWGSKDGRKNPFAFNEDLTEIHNVFKAHTIGGADMGGSRARKAHLRQQYQRNLSDLVASKGVRGRAPSEGMAGMQAGSSAERLDQADRRQLLKGLQNRPSQVRQSMVILRKLQDFNDARAAGLPRKSPRAARAERTMAAFGQEIEGLMRA